MTYAINNQKAKVVAVREDEHTIRTHTALFGLIKWSERVRTDSIATDIWIQSKEPIRDIYFNGKKINSADNIKGEKR